MEITPEQFAAIEHCLPKQRGNVSLSNLQVVNAILYVAEHGCKWRGLPKRFGNWHTIYTRMNRWAKAGVLDRMGLTWERIQKLNPRMIVASVKGFGPGPYEDCKVYENVAQCAGGAASTTGFRDGPPLVTGAQIGDSGTGLHLALGIVTALYQRNRTGRGQKVLAAMQDGVLNLCRVKLRDQQRLKHGPLTEYSQYGEGVPFGDATPRAGNDSGGGQPGRILKCKGWETDPNAYIYFTIQGHAWAPICKLGDWGGSGSVPRTLS